MKYLTVLALLFLVGCSSTGGPHIMSSVFNDYEYKAADGTVKVHRVYKNGNQEWLTASEAAAK